MISSRSGGRIANTAIPKVTDVFLVWRYYAREMTADLLRYYGVEIRDWYRELIDSRRILALLDGLPDESMFKTWAVRFGDWTEHEYVQARIANEVALSRADGKGYTPRLWKSPMQLAMEEEAEAYRLERHTHTLRQLGGEE